MRKHLLLFFLALLFIVSCKDSKNGERVISKDAMVNVLSDIHLVDGSLLVYGANDSLYKYGTNRYRLLFKKHGIDSATFNKSLKHYSAEPQEMMEIYTRINKLLTAKSDSLAKVQAKVVQKEAKQLEAKAKALQKKKADSLKRDSVEAVVTPKLKLNRKVL